MAIKLINRAWYYSSMVVGGDVLEQFIRRRSYIGQLEILAAIAPYFSLEREGSPLRGCLHEALVIHFIDNTSAIAALVRGYSGMPDSARLVHALHAFNVGLRALPWFAHVRSAANVSDAPSRGDVSY